MRPGQVSVERRRHKAPFSEVGPSLSPETVRTTTLPTALFPLAPLYRADQASSRDAAGPRGLEVTS